MGTRGVVRGLALVAAVLAAWGGTATAIGTIFTNGATITSAARPFPIGVTIDPAAPGTPPEPPDAGPDPSPPSFTGTMPAFPGAGDGSSGAFFTDVDTTLPAGTHQFTSFTVTMGAEVEVLGAATILVQGDVSIQGRVTTFLDDSPLTLICGGACSVGNFSFIQTVGTNGHILVVAGTALDVGTGGAGGGPAFGYITSAQGDIELRAHGPDPMAGLTDITVRAAEVNAPQGSITMLSSHAIVVGGNGPAAPGSATAGGGALLARAFGERFRLTVHGQIDAADGSPLTLEAAGPLDLFAGFGVGGSSPIRLASVAGPVTVNGGFSSSDGNIEVLSGGGIDLVANDTEIAIYGFGNLTMTAGAEGIGFDQQDDRCYTTFGNVTLVSAGDIEFLSNAFASAGGRLDARSTSGSVILYDSSSFTANGTLAIAAGQDVYVGAFSNPGLRAKPPAGQPLLTLGGDATVRGSRVEIHAEGSVTIDAAEARATGDDFTVQANGPVAVAGSVSAARDLFLVSMDDDFDLYQATLTTDDATIQPTGMIVVESWNPDATIDARFATITSGSGGPVDAEVFLLVHGPPAGPVASFLLPKKVIAKANGAKSRLVASGFFDTGPDPFDFAAPATVRVGGLDFPFDGLEPAGKSYRHQEEGLLLGIKPSKSGSSRARFRLVARGEAVGEAIDPESDLALGFDNGAIDGGGRVGLEKGKYTLGRKRGSLKAPGIWLVKAAATLRGEGDDSVVVRVGLATDGVTPETAPPVSVAFGDAAPVDFAPGDFLRDGDLFTGLGPVGGGTVRLDYARETLELRARGLDLGELPEGPQPITVTVVVGEDTREVQVRMVRKGKKLKY